ncbi:MAG: helix-turn-helix domain-containing protein [Promethearchaeota archaeon]|nr:MAG: helix-turn-helix domain-containing protein [Candidatus Lokiarchaeota archaeon]
MINIILQNLESLFKKNNYEILEFHSIDNRNRFCFDFLIKKGDLFFIVKAFSNIDNLDQEKMGDIKSLCLLLNCNPLLIGIKNRYNNLEDDTIYIRNGLPIVNIKTIKAVIERGIYPHILCKKRRIIFMDGNLMKKLRVQKNISRKDISEKIGVTKRTVCSYENESMRPSQKIAEQILKILENKSIFRNINLFEWQIKDQFDKERSEEARELSEFESELQDIFNHLGISTFWYKKGQVPFELSLFSSSKDNTLGIDQGDNFYPLFSGVSQENDNDKITKLNINNLVKFANLFHKNALFIVENDFKIPKFFEKSHIPIVKLKNLENLDDETDFKIEIFKEN